ncbi:zinc finger protein [Macleaya cordata]|uniref:Zinc finger protein n=1 Tax=Macleaya cordata TaxID=56857 RepID=A0A200R9S0_MACCD|nr:zinc finger protein [Macleaya cordata]
MNEVRPVQQKQENNDLREEFQRGLEEFMRGRFEDCMSLASCSSNLEQEEDGEEGDQLMRHRRRRSDIDGDDLAESSAARRRHSRILSRWAARQAQEMITTIERRNRESELMALARLHTVSTRDSSFLRESQSPTSRRSGGGERASSRASSLLQMWRELEDEHIVNRARERLRQQRSIESNTNLSSISAAESRGNENRASSVDASESENEYGTWSQGQIGSQNDRGDHESSSREQSPDLGEVERERVRQIARGWMDSGVNDRASNVSQGNRSPRAEWLGENERERVRLVREWVQMNSQQRGSRGSRGQEQSDELSAQIDRVRDGLVVEQDDGQHEHLRRDILRLRGRQALIDLHMRIERERQRELQGLLEYRAVSHFAHRNRIQALLRGRFLRSERPTADERPRSIAASELGLLRQQHTVSGLREGFRSRLENIRGQESSHPDTLSNSNCNGSRNEQTHPSTSHEVPDVTYEHSQPRTQESDLHRLSEQTVDLESNTASEHISWQGPTDHVGDQEEDRVTEYESRDWQQSTEVESNEWQDNNEEEMDGNWQEDAGTDWPQLIPGDEIEEDTHLQVEHEDWHEDGSQEAIDNWPDSPYDPQGTRHAFPIRRMNEFHPPDDDNVYSVELRELHSRRSVSTLLHSGFRESLDQLIQSYVERQGRAPVDWDLHRTLSMPTSSQQDQEQQAEDQNVDQPDTRPPFSLPSPPVPPLQPVWLHELHHASHTSWPRHSMHRSEYEWEIINDLRADVARLQQGMSHMQRMLEACMDMQLELQRSVRQEVSAALNRSATGGPGVGRESSEDDDSNWAHVRKGTCCVCCDSHIDSLLYRCGHMCTCSKCATELFQGEGKCPLCRAPIVEVIRAYSIL